MLYSKYFINIASVFVLLEANVLLTWELVCLFLLKTGWLVFGEWEIIFKCVIARFAMLLYNTVLIRLKQFFGLYENQPVYFYCKLAGWFLYR